MWSEQPWAAARRLLLGAAVMVAASAVTRADTLKPGQAFPDLREFALEGTLPDLTPARVVIVDFWASWCAPCKASFPVFDELQRTFGDQGLVIVAVNVDAAVRDMEQFIQRMRPGFAVVRDGAQKLVAAVDVPTMPTSYVLDGRGVVRFVHRGFGGEPSRLEYLAQIRTLLSEAP